MKSKTQKTIQYMGIASLLFFLLAVFSPLVFAEDTDDQMQQYLGMFNFLFRYVKENYVDDVEVEKLYNGAVKGMFEALGDPYSIYLSQQDMNALKSTTVGKFGGVGLYISKPDPGEDVPAESRKANYKFVEVIAPIEGTPAYKAGIHAGDYITQIEGESTEKFTIDDVVDKLKGTPGTKVTVSILRNENIEFDVTITRAIIEIPAIKKAMIGNIGYLRIVDWTPYTDNQVREAIDYFKQNNYTSMIVDLRGNPGGLLDSVVATADLFLSEGTIVSTRSRIPSENTVHTATSSVAVDKNIPLIVLIDKGSASASEIFAGAMKDTQRGYLMGATSYGKGSVQWVREFGETGFKLTVARYYTPSGVNVDKIGITPDFQIKPDPMTDKEKQGLKKILEENLINKFVGENPVETPEKTEAFIGELNNQGIHMKDKDIRYLVRSEYNRKIDFPPVFDLEFDVVLKAAVDRLQKAK